MLHKEDYDNINKMESEYTGGGCMLYVGDIDEYTFVSDGDTIDLFDKSLNMTITKFLDLEDDCFNGVYGKDITDGYEFVLKYSKYDETKNDRIFRMIDEYKSNNGILY